MQYSYVDWEGDEVIFFEIEKGKHVADLVFILDHQTGEYKKYKFVATREEEIILYDSSKHMDKLTISIAGDDHTITKTRKDNKVKTTFRIGNYAGERPWDNKKTDNGKINHLSDAVVLISKINDLLRELVDIMKYAPGGNEYNDAKFHFEQNYS